MKIIRWGVVIFTGFLIVYSGYAVYRLNSFGILELNSLVLEPCVFNYEDTLCLPSSITAAYLNSLSKEDFQSKWHQSPDALEAIVTSRGMGYYKHKKKYVMQSIKLIAEHQVIIRLDDGRCSLLDYADTGGDKHLYRLVEQLFFSDIAESERLNQNCPFPRRVNG